MKALQLLEEKRYIEDRADQLEESIQVSFNSKLLAYNYYVDLHVTIYIAPLHEHAIEDLTIILESTTKIILFCTVFLIYLINPRLFTVKTDPNAV